MNPVTRVLPLLAALALAACASSPKPSAALRSEGGTPARYYGDRGVGTAPEPYRPSRPAADNATPRLGFRFTDDEARVFSGPSAASRSVGVEKAGAAYRVSDGKGAALELCLKDGKRAWARASSGSLFSGSVDHLPECR